MFTEIQQIGVTTLGIEGAESSSTYSLTLHWDTNEYQWTNLIPNQQSKTYIKTFGAQSNTFCEFSSGFSLEMTASADDSVGIDSIIIKDESGYYYNIDMFCNSDQIQPWQRYNDSGQYCNDEWSNYIMYYGFIYNGTNPVYFIWDQKVFLNVNKGQQPVVVNDDIFSKYSCNENDGTPKRGIQSL